METTLKKIYRQRDGDVDGIKDGARDGDGDRDKFGDGDEDRDIGMKMNRSEVRLCGKELRSFLERRGRL